MYIISRYNNIGNFQLITADRHLYLLYLLYKSITGTKYNQFNNRINKILAEGKDYIYQFINKIDKCYVNYICQLHILIRMSHLVPKEGDIILDRGIHYVVSCKCNTFPHNVDEKDDNMYLVYAVYLYKGQYYTIPSSFSFLGTYDITLHDFTIVDHEIFAFEDLSVKICRKVCPGYLDSD